MQMASFPHHLPYAPDFAYLPGVFPFDLLPPPSAQQGAGDPVSASFRLPSYYPTFDPIDTPFSLEISKVNAGTSSLSAITTTTTTTTPTPESSISFESGWKVPCVDSNITSSSSPAQRSEAEQKTQRCQQKKRKDGQRCNSESAHSKDSEAGKARKLRKRGGATNKAEEKKAPYQTPTGYIHVRARRGEATDSHSLAERVRREKIRERMKMLQDLVPGCEKVVGKALMLEEIIDYVQSLQHQVEFLSMKLASMDPMLDDFGLDFDDFMIQTEKLENMSPGLPDVQRTGHVQPTATAEATKIYPLQDSTPPFLLHDQEDPGSFSQVFPLYIHADLEKEKDNGSNFVMQVVGNNRQSPQPNRVQHVLPLEKTAPPKPNTDKPDKTQIPCENRLHMESLSLRPSVSAKSDYVILRRVTLQSPWPTALH